VGATATAELSLPMEGLVEIGEGVEVRQLIFDEVRVKVERKESQTGADRDR
jgi:hypothetical protein